MKKIASLLMVALVAVIMPLTASAWSSHLIGLDPGHGGSDPGASGPSAPHEATLALRCATQVRDWITGQMGGSCKMTRTTDTYISLSARRSYSVSWDPWVFCSFHLNAFNGSANGTETWYYWSAGNSYNLAKYVHADLVSLLGRTNRGIKQNGWTVITGSSSVPAILTEALFVDNSTEWNMINTTSKEGFKNWARAHIYGFYDYLHAIHGMSGDPRSKSAISGSGTSTDPTPTPTETLTVSTTGLHFECYKGEHPTLEFTVKGENLTNDILVKSMTPGRFTCNGVTNSDGANLGKTGGTVQVQFNITDVVGTYGEVGTAVSYNFGCKVISGSITKEVKFTAEVKAPPLDNLAEKWNFSEKRGNATAKGYDATKIRNFCYQNGKLYCVYNHSDILVLNAQTGESLGFLNKGSIVSGGTYSLCDVKAYQGHIVACNLVTEEGQELRFYAWDNDQNEPYLLLNTTDFQGVTRVGDCLELSGTWDSDLYLSLGNDNGTDTKIIEYRRQNGTWSASNTKVTTDGTTHLSTQGTTRVYKQPGVGWWVDGKDSYPTWCTYDSASGTAKKSTFVDTGESWGSSHHEFNWGGQKYSANIVFNGKEYNSDGSMNNDANYKGARVRLIMDLTGDFTRMQQVGDFPSDGLGDVSRNTNATADAAVNTDGTNYIEVWVYSTTHGIAYYSYGDVPTHEVTPIVPSSPKMSVPSSTLAFETMKDSSVSKSLSVNAVALTGDVTLALSGANAEYFSLSTSTLTKDGGSVNITYAPKAVGSHTATLTLSSEGADNVTVTLTGTSNNPTYFDDNITELTQVWTNTSWAEIRTIAYQDGKIYALINKAFGTPTIKILDAYTGDEKGTLSVEGISGGIVSLSGIVAVGGKIFASNSARSTDAFRIYRWDSDTSTPAVALEIAASSHATTAMGAQISFTGDLNSGRIWTSDQATNNLIYFNVNGGNIDSTINKVALVKSDGSTAFSVGDAWGSAAVQDAGNGNFYAACKDNYPALFGSDGKMIEQMQANTCGSVNGGASINVFDFGSKKYALAGTYVSGRDNGRFALVNVTDGFGAAEAPIAFYPEAGLLATTNGHTLQNLLVQKRNDNQVLDVWFCSCFQGLGYWTYNGVKGSDSVEGIEDEVAAQFGIIADANTLAVVGVEAAEIELYNAAGVLVARNAGSQTINVSTLSGLYIVKVVDAEGKVNAAKVVLK
ncbi:MAG: N-acetylmuramoyl-L-alanine amidase [Muribaculaceae bacterium]